MKNLIKLKLNTVVVWLLKSFKSSESMPVHHFVELINKLIVVEKTRGLSGLIIYVKSVRSNLYCYLSGNSTRNYLSSTTKDGIPKVLGGLIPLIRRGSILAIALTLTILCATRAFKLKNDPDLETITQPSKTGDVTNLTMYMGSFWRDLGYRPNIEIPRCLEINMKSFRSKSGPNGHALSTAIRDARCLPISLIESLTVMSKGVLRPILLKSLRSSYFVDDLLKDFFNFSVEEGGQFRKLSSFPDKEGKTRTVGILDWYSQLCLKPLHRYLGITLSKIRQDCTLDQSKFKKTLEGSKIYYSVDLSAATDRFPISFIETLLKVQLPQSYVNAWKDVMVGYPFIYKGKEYNYSVGNPMGAYSSFNSFALAHHYIIYYCCKTLGKNWKKLPYALLGDDIVIGDSEVGDMYMGVIKSLGLEYSDAKTHKSEHFFEFAKRVFYRGEEITAFPISALKECGKSFVSLTTLLWEQSQRNWIPRVTGPSSVTEYFAIVKNTPSRRQKSIDDLSMLCWGVLNSVHGLCTADEFMNELVRRRNYRLPILSEEVCKNIFINCIVQAFADSNIMSQFENMTYRNMPLGKLYTSIQEEWSEMLLLIKDIHGDETYRSIRNIHVNDIPQVQAFFAVQEMYTQLIKDIEQLDSLGHDWSYKLRTFALPRSDKSILDKGNYTLSRSVNVFGRLVDEQLNILQMYPQLLQ